MLNISVLLKSKINLAIKMIATFILVLVISLLIYKLFIYPLNGDKASSLASMFGFAATLFTPIAAFFLLDSWKEQKRFELKKEYVALILHDLRNLYSNLINMLTHIKNIESTEHKLIIVSSYLNSEKLSNINLVHNIYSNIKVYSHLSKNTEIEGIFYDFEHHNYFVEIYYKEAIKRYSNYYIQFTQDRSKTNIDNLDIKRAYVGNEKKSIQNHVFHIMAYLSKPQIYQRYSESEEYVLTYKFKELFNNTKDLHDKIQEICLKEFKL